jgi:hypothetical protein
VRWRETSIERRRFVPAAAQRDSHAIAAATANTTTVAAERPDPDEADGGAGRQRPDSGERPVARTSGRVGTPQADRGERLPGGCSGVFSMPIATPCTPIATNRRAAPSSDGGATATRIHASG